MTIRDIEETIHTLKTRHPGLNEVMLLTLLKAGGWEDKDIQTAKMLFGPSAPPSPQTEQPSSPAPEVLVLKTVEPNKEPDLIPQPAPETKEGPAPLTTKNFPPAQDGPLFVPPADESHLVEAPHGNKEGAVVTPMPPVPEPVSLVRKEDVPATVTKEELPHNLPLRPFETSEHIWPFSRYRDVFYGEEQPTPAPARPVPIETPVVSVQPVIAPTHVVVNVTPLPQPEVVLPVQVPASPQPESQLLAPKEPSFRAPVEVEKRVVIVEKTGDEKLVIMACVMLLAILLLLGYMYSNGRL